MDFFDKLGETIVSAGRDVSQKAKDISGVAKLNLDIRAKEDFVNKQYAEIGRRYYDNHKNDVPVPYEQFESIAEALESIAQMKRDLNEIKGTRECPKCGVKSADGAAFCASCGAKLDIYEEDEPVEAEVVEEVVAESAAEEVPSAD